MPKKSTDNHLLNPRVWRNLVNFWTLVLYVATLADYFTRNTLEEFLGPICTIYIALLAIYTAEKEFERWHDYNIGRHPGEIYIFIWTVLIIGLLVLEVTHLDGYHLPSEVFSTYIVVMGILAITRKSKSSYSRGKKT
ncbi:MAG: hypothetical protein ABL899_01980 [Nitrospira sp.]